MQVMAALDREGKEGETGHKKDKKGRMLAED